MLISKVRLFSHTKDQEEVDLDQIVQAVRDARMISPDQYDYLVSYYSCVHKMFVYAGTIGRLNFASVPAGWLGDQARIKFRVKSIPLVDDEMINRKGRQQRGQELRRTKERKIGDVVQKVVKWRYVYNHLDEQSKSYSLDEAAQKVGMSK
eukprot:CAMPEP_0168334548 /NCGR_PEP_ID=MMETSP0213-20121227/10343_1 /TAXON_ID=151035 /ORGANISM="Euplotes harpa, Strain FSP1.4" /LENGTH=149 /DNA_ID=CAMNT_0008339233 /DNA_START=128 /DNA_END=577 /DNA_ORIENTATION=-